jgi:hypothetical protein
LLFKFPPADVPRYALLAGYLIYPCADAVGDIKLTIPKETKQTLKTL